jgi:hypothetical protein
MGMLIGRLILGAIWAFAVLIAVECLVAWRRPDPAKDDEQWRNEMLGGRMSAAPFLAAVAAVVIVTIVLAHALFGALSSFGGFIFFLIGAAIVTALRRKHLPSMRHAVLDAVREIKLVDDQQTGPDRLRPSRGGTASAPTSTPVERPADNRAAERKQAAAERGRPPRRKRRGSVPASTIDAQVKQAIERPAGSRSTSSSPRTAPAATDVRQGDQQALLDVRRALIARLQARSAALAAILPVAAPAIPVIPEAPGAVVASEAATVNATTGTENEDWRQDAAAQRELWRRAGEAQRQQWREEAQALQKSLGRPGQT